MEPALSPVWELSKTSNDMINLSVGFLQAATTNNVQPLALAACERFGATLPMSQETRSAVRILCSQGHQNQIIEHLKIQVGYRKGDSGWQLCQSDAGLRFLGLAACLLTFDRWSGAQMLQELIIATAADKVCLCLQRDSFKTFLPLFNLVLAAQTLRITLSAGTSLSTQSESEAHAHIAYHQQQPFRSWSKLCPASNASVTREGTVWKSHLVISQQHGL